MIMRGVSAGGPWGKADWAMAALVVLPILALCLLSFWLLRAERAATSAQDQAHFVHTVTEAAARIDADMADFVGAQMDDLLGIYGRDDHQSLRSQVMAAPLIHLATLHAADGTRLVPPLEPMLFPVEQAHMARHRQALMAARRQLAGQEGVGSGLVWTGSALDTDSGVIACRREVDGAALCLVLAGEGLRHRAEGFAENILPSLFPTHAVGSRREAGAEIWAGFAPPLSGWGIRIAPPPDQPPGLFGSLWFWALVLPVGASLPVLAGLVLWVQARHGHANREKMTLLAQITHDLRTPLANLRLYGALLERTPKLPEAARAHGAVIEAEATRLSLLVDNALSQAHRAEAEPVAVVTWKPVDPGALLADLIARYRPLLGSQRVSLSVSGLEGPVLCDGEALERIALNLLDNARKYAAGAAIDVTIDRPMVDRLVLTIADQGGRSVEPSGGGLGLGLSVCRALARRAGGALDWQRDATGCRCVVTLACASAQEDSA